MRDVSRVELLCTPSRRKLELVWRETGRWSPVTGGQIPVASSSPEPGPLGITQEVLHFEEFPRLQLPFEFVPDRDPEGESGRSIAPAVQNSDRLESVDGTQSHRVRKTAIGPWKVTFRRTEGRERENASSVRWCRRFHVRENLRGSSTQSHANRLAAVLRQLSRFFGSSISCGLVGK